MLSAAFAKRPIRRLNAANSELGSPVCVREPRPPDKLTMRPDADRFNSGSLAWVTANVPKKLVSKVFRTASRLAAPADPSPELAIPALLIRISSRPSSASISAAAPLLCQLGQIDLHIAGGEAFAPEFCHGSLAPAPIACADENVMPFMAKLARDLEADALVGPSNEGDAVFRGLHEKFLRYR